MIPYEIRKKVTQFIIKACAEGARKGNACEVVGISIRTLQRWLQYKSGQIKEDQRNFVERTPKNKLSAQEKDEIITVCNSEEYKSLPPTQIVPALADTGCYIASESSFYRVLRENNLLNHRGKSSIKKNNKPKGFIATRPNQVWTWDITYLPSVIRGEFYYLYMITDIYSRKIVGWEVHDKQTDELASELLKRTYLSEGVNGKDIVLHSDNGSPMKGATMLATLQFLGVIPSFSRPSVSNDNAYSEALFKTLKYTPAYPSMPFNGIDSSRQWVFNFVNWYNTEHRHSGIKYVTPNQRHCGMDGGILNNRKKVYANAKKKRPERWANGIRNWDKITEVKLNPSNNEGLTIEKVA